MADVGKAIGNWVGTLLFLGMIAYLLWNIVYQFASISSTTKVVEPWSFQTMINKVFSFSAALQWIPKAFSAGVYGITLLALYYFVYRACFKKGEMKAGVFPPVFGSEFATHGLMPACAVGRADIAEYGRAAQAGFQAERGELGMQAATGGGDARRAQIYAAAARAIESAVRAPAAVNAGASDSGSVSGSSSSAS